MNPQDWSMVKEIFSRAVALPPGERGKWLKLQAIPEDVRQEAERLLGHATEGESVNHKAESQVGGAAGISSPPGLFDTGEILCGRFEIISLLGRGGMGEVYRAKDLEIRQDVALKVVKPEFGGDPRWAEQLRREVQIVRGLRHESVCRMFDLHRFRHSGAERTCVAMELIEGQTLADEIREKGPLDLAYALDLTRQIASGLDAVHEAGIVHRDLKCGNIMISGDRAIIMDFGLSRTVETTGGETTSLFGPGAIVGTPAYMSPEQLSGERATSASDIHCFGVILYEMVTGQLPFQGATPLAIALRRMDSDAPTAGALRIGLPPAWDIAIAACLAKEPNARPKTAAEAWGLLNRQVSPASVLWRRHRSKITVGVAALCIAGTTSYWTLGRTNPPPVAAVQFVQRGEELARKLDAENVRAAIAEFERATSLDPQYHDAWLNLAKAHAKAAHYALLDPAKSRLAAAKSAGEALRIAPDSPGAQGIHAYVLSTDFERWRQAEPLLKRAVAADPENSELHCWYAVYLGRVGRHDEAVEEARRAVSVRSGDYQANHQLAVELIRARRFPEAVSAARELVRLRSTEPEPYAVLARSLEWTGSFAEAETAIQESERYARSERNRVTALAHRATLAAARGDRQGARKIAARIREYWDKQPFEANLVAGVYASLRDPATVASILEGGLRRGDASVLASYTNPYVTSIRDAPELKPTFLKLGFVARVPSGSAASP